MKFKKFKLGDLFTKKTIRWVPKNEENLEENKLWYHMFGQNIKYQYPQKILLDPKYLQIVDPEYPILWYTSSVWEIWIITESFYRSWNNWAFQWLFPKVHKYTKNELLFILSVLQKQFSDFWYDTSMSNVLQMEFELPENNWEINYSVMDQIINISKKLSIKNVVDLADRKIRATKEVINKN